MRSALYRHARLATFFVVSTVVSAGAAHAHTKSGALNSTVKGATDLWLVSCSPDANGAPERLEVHVRDELPKAIPLVNVQVLAADGSAAKSSSDNVDGDGNYSNIVKIYGGAGPYYVLVNKTRGATEIYTLEYHCMASSGSETETVGNLIQNE